MTRKIGTHSKNLCTMVWMELPLNTCFFFRTHSPCTANLV